MASGDLDRRITLPPNRTLEELKPEFWSGRKIKDFSPNRTLEELKRYNGEYILVDDVPPNRTLEELKLAIYF